MKQNTLKARLYQGELVVGPFLKLIDPTIVEIAALAGFDFVIIDSEHGPISMESAQNMIRAAEARRIAPIIRVLKNEEESILRVLDLGPAGIEIPQINNLKQARTLKKATKYAPEGRRGVCCYVRGTNYSQFKRSTEKQQQYFEHANNETLVIAHIEGLEGVNNLPDLLQEDAIDVYFIGPYDLSQSLNRPGQVDHPEVVEKMGQIIREAKKSDKIIGTFVDNLTAANKWAAAGVQFIAYSVDVGLIYEKFLEVVSNWRKLRDARRFGT